jgi:peptidoglycan/LPS O-acetylase OafA/YrhL
VGDRPKSERDDLLDVAKGIAILGVVLLHAHAWLASIGVESQVLDFVAGRMTIPLPEFFLVSALVVSSSLVGPLASRSTLWRRVAPLLWLYLLWQPLVFAYRVFGDLLVTREPVDWSGELLRFVAFPVRPNGELWYLWALAVLFVVTFATRRAPAAVVMPVAAVLTIAVFGFGRVILGDTLWHQLGPGLQQLLPHALFVLVGARWGRALLTAARRTPWWGAVAAVVVWQGWAVAVSTFPPVAKEAGVPLQVVLGSAATFMAAAVVSRARISRPFAALGRGSLPVYILHTAAISVVLAIVVALGWEPVLDRSPVLTVGALIALVVSATWAVGRVVQRSRAAWLFTMPKRSAVRRPPAHRTDLPSAST